MNERCRIIMKVFLILGCAVVFVASDCLAQTLPTHPTLTELADGEQDAETGDMRDSFIAALLTKLRVIVDTGVIDNPKAIAGLLELRFRERKLLDNDASKACQEPHEIRRTVAWDFSVIGGSWIDSTKFGKPGYRVPGAGVNQAYTVAKQAQFHFSWDRYATCADPEPPMVWQVHAQLEIGQLPALVCLSPADIERVIPEVISENATDGIQRLTYGGRPGSHTAARLNFVYQFGSECAVGLDIFSDHRVMSSDLPPLP